MSTEKLAIIGASGKLGSASLRGLLSENSIPKENLVCLSSAQPGSQTWLSLEQQGVQVRHATFDDETSIATALEGCSRFFLISSPRIALDFPDAGPGTGREKDHYVAIGAALKAGIRHIYYASLAFGSESQAGVMRAHLRTEQYLRSLKDVSVTVLRQGLYNESWPLYLGYFNLEKDDRTSVELPGDGLISWTALPDLGLANAVILAEPVEKWAGKTAYLSSPQQNARSMAQVADIVGKARGKATEVALVSVEQHVQAHVKRGEPEDAVRWWASTYAAVDKGECLVDDRTLPDIVESRGRGFISMEETINDMIRP